jgi:N-acetylneuraminic acid mutarotase
MKVMRFVVGAICVFALFAIESCNNSDPAPPLGNWVKAPPFKGHGRSGAFCFTIGNTVYIGLGYDGTSYRLDGYTYNIDSGYWRAIAPFPGEPREKAISFSIGEKGYVGTGYNRDSTIHQLKDFWEYNPSTNVWTQLNDFGGAARYNAIAFADGTNGFVGTGYDGDFYGDFWRYSPSTDTWKEIADYPGDKRQMASIMIIDSKVYMMGGINNSGITLTDLWQFDADHQSWVNETPLTTDAQYGNFKIAVTRYDAVTFTITSEGSSKGYITTGTNGAYLNSTYQFDPVALTWTNMTPYERAPRSQAVGFTLGNRGFVATGGNTSYRFDNADEFQPEVDYNVDD